MDVDDADVAQALGFASFGAQPRASKKRKYNPRLDAAFVAPSAPNDIPVSTSSVHSANETVQAQQRAAPMSLASRTALSHAASGGLIGKASNDDEIDLDDDDDGDGEPGGEEKVVAERAGGAAAVQDAISNIVRDEGADLGDGDGVLPVQTGGGLGLPSRPDGSWGQQGGPSAPGGRGGRVFPRGGGGGHHGGGGSGTPWWQGYYDPSFNENPWARLEQAMGIASKGSWLSRGGGPSGGPSVAT